MIISLLKSLYEVKNTFFDIFCQFLGGGGVQYGLIQYRKRNIMMGTLVKIRDNTLTIKNQPNLLHQSSIRYHY